MSKPIAVINIPYGGAVTWNACNELTEEHNREKPDYYWFFLLSHTAESIEFEVFYEKDFSQITYDELKELILEKINSQKPIP